MKIPLCRPYFDEKEYSAVKEVMQSGWLAHGPKTTELENNFAQLLGVKKAVAVNSCASALQLAILATGKVGEIILPSFTFVASANAIIHSGCTPVFADIDYETCNIDPQDIRKKITDKTIALMPVHFAGQPCDMKAILEIAKDHNLMIIEDSAETIGGMYNNKMAGSFGIGCFSFYPTKNMTCGEGGMVTTDDEKLAEIISALRAHGMSKSAFDRSKERTPWYRAATYAGFNYRMSDIAAAIAVEQLKKLNRMNDLRIEHARYLSENIKSEHVVVPKETVGVKHVYQMYTIKVTDNINRDQFVKYLRSRGVEASVHFHPPVHQQPFYKNTNGKLPVTDVVSSSIVTLPMFPQLSKEELDFIISSIDEAISAGKKK